MGDIVAASSNQTYEPVQEQANHANHATLKPKYCTHWIVYDLPLVPCMTHWVFWEKHLYALILSPYYFWCVIFTFFLSYASYFMISLPCCKAFWCCCSWLLVSTCSLFLWPREERACKQLAPHLAFLVLCCLSARLANERDSVPDSCRAKMLERWLPSKYRPAVFQQVPNGSHPSKVQPKP